MLNDNEISVSKSQIIVGGRVRPKFTAFYAPTENRWACFLGENEEPYTFLIDQESVLDEIKRKYPNAKSVF